MRCFAELKEVSIEKRASYLVSWTRCQDIFNRYRDPVGRSQLSVVMAME